jgi:hypothetical protein
MVEKLAANDEAALHDIGRPNAVRNHPSDEHLLPLYFARGAGGISASRTKASPWVHWAWTSIASADRYPSRPATGKKIPEPVGDFYVRSISPRADQSSR